MKAEFSVAFAKHIDFITLFTLFTAAHHGLWQLWVSPRERKYCRLEETNLWIKRI